MNAELFSKNRIGLAVTLAAGLCASAGFAETESPYATGGEVTVTDLGNFKTRYIHVFTNTDEVATFRNVGKKPLSLRYLVVGGGGSGGNSSTPVGGGKATASGGGGGGGGVCEVRDVQFATGAEWSILVGKGAKKVESSTKVGTAAGASSISNVTVAVAEAEVPGGGNGAKASTAQKNVVPATAGAAGGGGTTYTTSGGAGTYESSIFGVKPADAPFAGGEGGNYLGGGGGGAAAAGTKYTTSRAGDGGEGLVSDITGEELVYGSGGGGGAHTYYNRVGGLGGTRAGNGATYEVADGGATTNFYAATAPAANSGCGGAGGMQDGNCNVATDGADGVVIIRYEVTESPCGGGDVVTRTELRPGKYRYLHVFTNTAAVSQFANLSGRELKLRYLVVGGGGSGGYGSAATKGGTYSCGGSGGGGGGVYEEKDVPFGADAEWSILVGKGAEAVVSRTNPGTVAGSSSISKGATEAIEVPGGGNGARGGSGSFVNATAGAAGGGDATYAVGGAGKGEYPSSIFGVVPDGAPFGGGEKNNYAGAGGGGAGAAGMKPDSAKAGNGGAGLSSDITGELLMYGSGGGGGAHLNRGLTGGFGGTRAGDGATYEITDGGATTNFFAATMPAANSGCGGAGGMQDGKCNVATDGADGVVIIRYDYVEDPQGLILIFR